LIRATIIHNPASRKAPNLQRLREAAAEVERQDWQIDIVSTEGPGHGIVLARAAAEAGASVVLACGGDGILNEVANGLIGSETSLGLIRGGMGNVFAKEVGVPRRPEDALKLLVEGERRRFDLGLAGKRYFLLMAGVGLDARIVRAVPGNAKQRLGSTSYAIWGAREALAYRGRNVELRLDGQPWQGDLYWLLLGNTRSYGGVVDITSQALADDGRLDAYVYPGRGPVHLLGLIARVALRRHQQAPSAVYRRLREVEVLTPGLSVQVDGEYLGETPMRFQVVPRALSVLLPRGRAEKLFGATDQKGQASSILPALIL
jgi:YegS/Rv2252/BmrU family lipid kinase